MLLRTYKLQAYVTFDLKFMEMARAVFLTIFGLLARKKEVITPEYLNRFLRWEAAKVFRVDFKAKNSLYGLKAEKKIKVNWMNIAEKDPGI